MEKILADKAAEFFDEGYNCSESILKAYLDVFKKNPTLGAAASGFGGGIGGKGLTCGAITGAVIALGIHHNRQKSDEKEVYASLREKTLALLNNFEKEIGSFNCKDLQPYDLTTLEGREKLHDDKEAAKKCKSYLATSAKLLIELLE